MPVAYFSHASNARRAARKALGTDAKEGDDYELIHAGAGVRFEPIVKARPAKSSRVKKAPANGNGRNVTAEVRKVMGLSAAEIKAKSKANRRARQGKSDSVEVRDAEVRATNTWLDQLLAMLARPQGATALEVGEAFGWLEHTSRARISVGPRSRNARAERTREERPDVKTGKLKMVSVYRLASELPLGQKRDELGVRYVKPVRERKARVAA